MKLIPLLLLLLAACNESNSTNKKRFPGRPICGGDSKCAPLADWTLLSALRPLDFKATIVINDEYVVLDECEEGRDHARVSEDRRMVNIPSFMLLSRGEVVSVSIQSWDESCTVSTEFYSNPDAPVELTQVERRQQVLIDLDR
jgi:hypothetical protein